MAKGLTTLMSGCHAAADARVPTYINLRPFLLLHSLDSPIGLIVKMWELRALPLIQGCFCHLVRNTQ